MPSGGRRKPLNEMTRSELVATSIAFVVIGGAIIAGCTAIAIGAPISLFTLCPVAGIAFVGFGVIHTLTITLGELRRRRKSGG